MATLLPERRARSSDQRISSLWIWCTGGSQCVALSWIGACARTIAGAASMAPPASRARRVMVMVSSRF